MEIVLITKRQSVGLNESVSGLRDIDYFSALPGFHKCFGMISQRSLKMLENYRKKEIESSMVCNVKLESGNFVLNKKDNFILYDIKDIEPVLYEVIGYNCIINFKEGIDINHLEPLKYFFFKDNNFNNDDFNNLEIKTNYLISSYYEGEASFIYTNDNFVQIIIEVFNKVCIKKCGEKITVDKLQQL